MCCAIWCKQNSVRSGQIETPQISNEAVSIYTQKERYYIEKKIFLTDQSLGIGFIVALALVHVSEYGQQERREERNRKEIRREVERWHAN